jgi:hypothetical protein
MVHIVAGTFGAIPPQQGVFTAKQGVFYLRLDNQRQKEGNSQKYNSFHGWKIKKAS